MLLKNLLEHILNDSDKTGSLWFFSENQSVNLDGAIPNNDDMILFRCKCRLSGNTKHDVQIFLEPYLLGVNRLLVSVYSKKNVKSYKDKRYYLQRVFTRITPLSIEKKMIPPTHWFWYKTIWKN